MSIYFITGASGSGKTAVIPYLKELLDYDIALYDFDEIGVPEGADKKWRQESTEKWLQKILSENRDVILFGQMVLGEILACPSAKRLGMVNLCLLDVSDMERIKRLQGRPNFIMDQHMLNWAAWLRVHHQSPDWAQHVVKEDAWGKLDFSSWDTLDNWASKASIKIIDTTDLSLQESAEKIIAWMNE